jgi:tetratricopeptide (TPR) repeat protein
VAYRAIALARLGDVEAARAEIEEALKIAPQAGSPVKEADIHIAVSMAFYDLGELEKGLQHARIGADLAYGANGLECAAAGFFCVGKGQLERRKFDDALLEFGKSLKIADEANSANFAGYVNMIRGGVAVAEFQQGTATAIDKLRIALNNARSSHDEFAEATMSQELAAALRLLGKREEGRPLLDFAIDYYRTRGMRPYLARALDLDGAFLAESGKPDEAARRHQEAAALRAPLPAPGDVAKGQLPAGA